MNDRPNAREGMDDGPDRSSNAIAPLPGEPGIPNVAERSHSPMSKKGLLAVALLILSLVAVSAFSIQRFTSSGKKADDSESNRVSDRPTAATSEPRKLEMPGARSASAVAAVSPRIPALVPTAEETAEPIGVRRTGKAHRGPAARRQFRRRTHPSYSYRRDQEQLACPMRPRPGSQTWRSIAG